MKVLLYIGNHAKDDLLSRLGWFIIRSIQSGEFKQVTHCEAILEKHTDGTYTIASSSLRDGGVRIKRTDLTKENWRCFDVPVFKVEDATEWFKEHNGSKYDVRGAVATIIPFGDSPTRWFCNEAVGAAVGLLAPEQLTPSEFAAICASFGTEIHDF